MTLFLDNYMLEHFDYFTIYNFYNELNIKLNNLVNYCIKKYDDELLINNIIEISNLYGSLVMKQLNII